MRTKTPWVVILLFICGMALVGPWISPHEYAEIHLALKNSPPSLTFWLGTDELGRDLFTRICYGARISLFIGIAAVIIDGVLGILWGSIAAYCGGKVDEAMMRLADVLYTIPYLLVVILLTVVRGSGIGTILIAMTCTGWINMARICRSQVLQLKTRDFVLAAKVLGASHGRIVFFHMIPNMIGPVATTMMLSIPSAIFTEAFLSFVGLGVQAPAASWGSMIHDGVSAMRYYPWRLLFPASAMILAMLSFNFLGNTLQEKQ